MTVLPQDQTLHDCSDCEYRSHRMFCNLSPDTLTKFEGIGILEKIPKGTTLFSENDPSSRIWVICTGQVKLSCTSKEGRTLILKIAKPGDVLGLSAVISGYPHEVTAVTIEPVQIKSVRNIEFMMLLRGYGDLSLHAAMSISMEYKTAFFDARRLALSTSIAGRLATILLEWGRDALRDKSEMRFRLALTHEDIAGLLSTSRETVTRQLGKFQRDKLILIHGSSILILSPEGLERFTA